MKKSNEELRESFAEQVLQFRHRQGEEMVWDFCDGSQIIYNMKFARLYKIYKGNVVDSNECADMTLDEVEPLLWDFGLFLKQIHEKNKLGLNN